MSKRSLGKTIENNLQVEKLLIPSIGSNWAYLHNNSFLFFITRVVWFCLCLQKIQEDGWDTKFLYANCCSITAVMMSSMCHLSRFLKCAKMSFGCSEFQLRFKNGRWINQKVILYIFTADYCTFMRFSCFLWL